MTGRVLVVDPVPANRIAVRAGLAAAQYETQTVACLSAVGTSFKGVDIVIASAGLGAGQHAVLAKACAAAERAPHLIVLTDPGDAAARLSALRCGADDAAARSGEDSALLARLRAAMRARGAMRDLSRQMRDAGLAPDRAQRLGHAAVSIISGHPDRAHGWGNRLRPEHGMRCVVAAPDRLLSTDTAAEVFLVDGADIVQGKGTPLVADVRARVPGASIFCLVPGDGAVQTAAALDLGADAVQVGFDCAAEIALRLRRLAVRKRAADRCRNRIKQRLAQAILDPLTGLANRRHAMERLRCLGAERRLALIAIDLDRFKTVNDGFGHAAGDDLLRAVAAALGAAAPRHVFLARMGGDEFLAAGPVRDLSAAAALAETFRDAIAGRAAIMPGRSLTTTASFGVALSDPREPIAQALACADAALLAAKAAGRNHVRIAEETPA
ncbi:MAG: GGDEF domain-containing protein [Pseudomonadota bacterium]